MSSVYIKPINPSFPYTRHNVFNYTLPEPSDYVLNKFNITPIFENLGKLIIIKLKKIKCTI